MKQGARASAQVGWYEAGLPLDERKQRGHFSTPPALVDQMLDACGYSASADLRHLRVLDPACGSGNFLARAARRLCLCELAQGLDKKHAVALVRRNIWGLDPDPVACFLAEMQVRANIDETCQDCLVTNQPSMPMQRDTAVDTGCRARSTLRPPSMQGEMAVDTAYKIRSTTYRLPLHIHQADSLVLPWKPCADLLLANPPYLATKNTDLSHYRLAHRRGQVDSYLLFLDLALRVVRPGGWIALVLPDPVLARANATSERARLLSAWTLHHLWHLSGVFAAEVGATVLIAQNVPPRALHQVRWTRGRWQARRPLRSAINRSPQTADQEPLANQLHQRVRQEAPTNLLCQTTDPRMLAHQPPQTVSQALLASQPGAELRYLLNSEQGRVSERLRRALEQPSPPSYLLPLAALVDMKRGEELGREHSALSPLAEHVDGHPVLRGGVDLRPYARPQSTWGIEREAIKKPIERYLEPKLLVVKSSGHLQAVLDTRGHVVLQTLYILRVREHIESLLSAPLHEETALSSPHASGKPHLHNDLALVSPSSHGNGKTHPCEETAPVSPLDIFYFLLALLNSRLLCTYVLHLHTAYKLVHPQIEQGVLARLPVAWGTSAARREIGERARELERACSETEPVVEWEQPFTVLYEEQERAIRALYATAVPGIFDDKGVMTYD